MSATARACLAPLLAAALLAGAACYNRKDYLAPTDPAKAFITLTAAGGPACTPPSGATACLPADGLAHLLLTARITGDSTSRTVVFATTGGTLAGASGDGGTKEVSVDSTGAAAVELLSARQVGTAVVTAQVKDKPQVAASFVLGFVAPDQNGVIQSLSVPATAPADGATPSLVSAQVSADLGASNRTVTFTTTAGSFTAGAQSLTATVTAGADGKASTLLYSPTATGAAVVSASVFQNSKQAVITFLPALPDAILVAVSPASVPDTAKDTVTITAQLVRGTGAVTPNTVVSFAVQDAKGVPFGTFTSIQASNSTGLATAVFSPGGTGHTGRATVT
ncbi:MAG: hypothetical protein M3O15_15610, partial [Acidobacteriota bacterium]|nr:hypothetical protein [Acidobacteriota bacterium]